MGIVPCSIELLNRHIAHIGGLRGCRIMEIGDQQMYCHPNVPEGSAAKIWFGRQGAALHVSVDLNGLLGALPLNLARPIEKPEFDLNFDIVTDFGTSEHVGPHLLDLYNCRANCHRWCRSKGLLLFMNPKTGHWPGHGYHYFTQKHYEALADACGYRVLEISEAPSCGNTKDGWQVHAVFLKQNEPPFISFERYQMVCANTVFTK